MLQYKLLSDKDVLVHAGVKGMRWGQRKADTDGSDISSTSDKALSDMVKRMRLEKEFRTLAKELETPSVLELAVSKTTAIVGTAAQQALTSFATKKFNEALAQSFPSP